MSPTNTDRNLLFGILALQMDFISRDALIQAMHAWVLEKTKPLGQVLHEQDALSAERRALLEALVEEHLKLHGNDAEKSLAVVSSLGSVREELKQIADAEVQASLAHVSFDRAHENDLGSTGPFSVGAATSAGMRFHILRPHAKGGLGQVSVALDQELHREVALKEIQELHADDANSRARFVLEAEITGGLEHPGIVPVYGLGTYADGRPFYAMRFIKGDNLKAAIERFHGASPTASAPGDFHSVEFRQLLGRFVDVCNAVAYAHSRGVLHRDLKPGNVMLGKFGETLVVDWGLAKAVGRAGDVSSRSTADEPTLRPSSGSDVAATQAGTAIGTPAYMPPEQAAGQLDQLGPASDIYSLGATLYCLLTGQPPFREKDRDGVLPKVQQGDFPRPRQVIPRVPAVLEAICLKAMALHPEDRYPTPTALAEEIEHWLADEPVSAYREPLLQRTRRWARKHKPLVAGLVALLFTALLLGGGFGLLWKQQHDALVGAVQDHLNRAEQLRDAEQWDQARQALDRAEARLAGGGPAGLHGRLQQLREQLEVVGQLDEARMKRLVIVDNRYDIAGADRSYAAVFARQSLNPLVDGAETTARQVAQSPIRKQLAVALDDWAIVREDLRKKDAEHLLAVARLVDDDPWRQQLRDPRLRHDRTELERLANQKDVLAQPPANLYVLSLLLYQSGATKVPERLLRQVQQQHPSDFLVAFELGNRVKYSHTEEGIGFYRAALALQPRNGAVHNNLGNLLRIQKRPGEAETAYRTALELQPDFAGAWNNLGLLWNDQKKTAQAEAAYRKAISLQPDLALAWNHLGNLLQNQKKLVEAEAAFRKAIELQPDLAMAWANLGNLLVEQKKPEESEAAYLKAIELQPDLAAAWYNLGLLLRKQKKPAEAAYRKAIELRPTYPEAWYHLGNLLDEQKKPAEAEAAYRKAVEFRPDYVEAWTNLGVALRDQKKPVEAEAAYRKAIEIQPKHLGAWNNLANLLADQKKFGEAEAAYRKAIALQPNDAMIWYNFGIVLKDQKKQTQAEAAYRKAVELRPNYPEAWNNLGALLGSQNNPAGAEVAFRKVTELQPNLAEAHCNLGHMLRTQGRFIEALASLQRGHGLGSRDPDWPYPSALWIRQAERLVELDAKLPSILKGETKPADAEQIELAQMCQRPYKQLHAASARFYRDAFAAQPKLAEDMRRGDRYNAACAAALAGCGQGKDADNLDEKERTRLREQALAWLKVDLAAWSALLKNNPEKAAALVQQKMQHWQTDPDLAGVRDVDALAKLPEDECKQWQQLWAEVEALRQRAAAPK